MLEKKKVRIGSGAPLSARPSVSRSTCRMSVCTLPGSSFAEVLEGEHEGADLLRGVAVQLVERRQEARTSVCRSNALKTSAIALCASRRDVCETVVTNSVFKRFLDVLERFLLDVFHLQHTVHHIDRELVRKDREDARGMIRPDAGEDDGNGLRILVAQIVCEHVRVDVGQALPHAAACRSLDLVHERLDLLRRQDLRQELRGPVE